MAASESVRVTVVTDCVPNIIPCSNTFTAEELCTYLCKKYGIPPLTRTLFALRIKGTELYLKDNHKVHSSTKDYELRIRYKVPRLSHLITLDETTYDYYFQQARNDLNENKIKEITYPEYKNELLGLGITDMTRAVSEKNLAIKDVLKNYKKYIPKIIVKKHGTFPKKHVCDKLPQLCSVGHNANYVKNLYMQQLYGLAPNYLAEEYDNVVWINGPVVTTVKLVVAPFHPHEPGIRLYKTNEREWSHICSIEELIYLTRNGECSLEMSRRGTPLFFQFKSEEQLSSFISVCDGYYRLMVKWTFNLSKDDETPSLKELLRLKCHGPVGGAFSYRKLEEKRGKKHGCYILRQCQDEYNVYYLDVCTKNNTTETYKIVFKGHCYVFNKEEYFSIERLVSCHQNPDGRIYLNECIPPSEYDKSQLLLCGEQQKRGIRIDEAELQEIHKNNKSPRCLPNKDILLYKNSERIGSSGITAVYKALWRLDETKKILVAFKTLQPDKVTDHLKDFIDLASKWACVQSSSIVRLHGVTLGSPTAMVLSYLPYGPLDYFLRENERCVSVPELVRVCAGLARALWDLSEAGVVHGGIRCRRLLLAAKDPARPVVKLAGPSLKLYAPSDIHWIPVEFFLDMEAAKKSVVGDIWAFATTLWEIFSYGQSPAETNPVLTARSYEVGERLVRPARCPAEVWALARHCWQPDPPRPQEIMRDLNHLLHADYLPHHDYEELKIALDHIEHPDTVSSDKFMASEVSDGGSNKSLITDASFPSANDTLSDYENPFASSNSLDNMNALVYALSSRRSSGASGAGAAEAGGEGGDEDEAGGAPRLMESIVSQGKTYLVTYNKRIGSGNYGRVYKGWMERDNQESERTEVAVKKLTRQTDQSGSLYEDFKNELEIMKSLSHINIVEILGYAWEPGRDVLIVMEYLEQGSLHHYLRFQGDRLRICHLLKYCKDIAAGMDHVSAKSVVRRDLATRNILVVNKYHVKISDFGLARALPKEESAYRLKTERLLPINWYAPESAVEPWQFSAQSDVWSYGVTAWEVFGRCARDVPAFDARRPQLRATAFQMPDGCPSEIFRYLMKDCWHLDPSRRPKFIDLVHLCKRFMDEYK